MVLSNIVCKLIKFYIKNLWFPYLPKQCIVYLVQDCWLYGSKDGAMLHMRMVLLLISWFGDLVPLPDK
jgi:hypothetical protein